VTRTVNYKPVCTKCLQEKSWDEFKLKPGTKRGRSYTCKDCDLLSHKLNKYNITETEYVTLYESQNKACAVCEKELPLMGKSTHIDHDHETGKIRGILCSNCNTALGLLKDNIDIILSLALYKQNSQ
jgi:hypothetical protein